MANEITNAIRFIFDPLKLLCVSRANTSGVSPIGLYAVAQSMRLARLNEAASLVAVHGDV